MSRIKIKSKKELQLLRDSGILAQEILERAGELVKPGITTNEIDAFVDEFTRKNGAISAPLNYRGYPKSVCTSINEVVTHGIPDETVLQDGDIINIDVTCKLKGYHGDTSKTFLVGNVSEEAATLVKAAEESMWAGIETLKEDQTYFGDIGFAIQEIADNYDFTIVKDYCGHGIGRGFHEEPYVLHYESSERGALIREGMVFTIEPMINAGTWKTKLLDDGWTAVTADGSLSAQFEHTIAITSNGVEILTGGKIL